MYRSKPFTRREALKLGALGSAGLLLPLERFAGAAGGASANRMPSSGLPAPFSLPFRTPPVLSPVRTDATTDYYRLVQQQAWSRSCLASRRRSSATTASRRARRSWRSGTGPSSFSRSTHSRPCTRPSATRRMCPYTCTGRPRCRNTTATPATSSSPGSGRTTTTRTTIPHARSGTTTTHVGITAENAYFGLAGHVRVARRPGAEPRAAERRLRRAARSSRTRCSRRTAR